MTDNVEDFSTDKAPERPLECGECKRPVAVYYTEVVKETITQTCMCSDCPCLRRRLHGSPHITSAENIAIGETGLACGNCGTTLEAIHMGTPLGCYGCYEVFDDILLSEMIATNKVPSRIAAGKKSVLIHIGRAPGEIKEINPSLRVLALNEALTETLKSEDYEQAAWLRDQIKALTEHAENKNDGQRETPNDGK